MSNPINSKYQGLKNIFISWFEEQKIINTPDSELVEYVANNPNPAFQKHLDYINELNIKNNTQ